ncbi:MAG TPA: sigma-54 dependent transcriptional regulator [Steroidobacteraceae bacterium]|nr:sigma-54 dependent transcriptional regulator [Steroidobacteraceae bacterium]
MNAVARPLADGSLTPAAGRHVLVAEDDAALRDALVDTLRFAGCRVTAVADGAAALAALETERPGLVLSDVQMAPTDGYELLLRVRSRWPEIPVVLITAYGSIERAVAAMRDGAADYLVKPFDADALIGLVARLGRVAEPADDADAPVAADPRSLETLALARRIARTDVTVLITGESGTGKEVFARYLHAQSTRRAGPFTAINCAAIPETMLEAVLFGHEKGAFTGASTAHTGKFEQAQGGTLLLDEISEMGLSLQAKLLRVLQEREVERIGGTRAIKLDVRVIATSNRQLGAEVAAGRFREDLYYRLNVMPLRLAPLRDRPRDVLPLAERVLARLATPGQAPLALSAAAAERLAGHGWPGNVRELDNVMQRAAVLAGSSTLTPAEIVFESEAAATAPPAAQAAPPATPAAGAPLEDGLKDRERDLIIAALEATDGSRKRAAERLGISARTLRYKLAQLRAAGVALP